MRLSYLWAVRTPNDATTALMDIDQGDPRPRASGATLIYTHVHSWYAMG